MWNSSCNLLPQAQHRTVVSSAQPRLRKEKNSKIRHVQSHSCRCQEAALSQRTPIGVAGRRLTLQFFGSSTPFKKPLLTTSLLERSSLHTAFCCRERTCHSQQLSLSKPGYNYKSVREKYHQLLLMTTLFSLRVILQWCSSTVFKSEKKSRIWPQLLTFCPLN